MTAAAGLVIAAGGAAGGVVVELDVRAHRFLRDHEVGGRALLSTVMGIETMAVAVRHARPGVRIAAVTDVRVGPPYLLPATGRGSVTVELTGADPVRCTVRSDVGVHFTADVELAAGTASRQPTGTVPPPRGPATVGGELVYGLYFHGPSFRVIDEAWLDGATTTARLSPHRPPAVEGRRSLTAPLLVELALQAAGLADLAEHDAMTIPLTVARVRRFSDLDADDGDVLHAVVRRVDDASGERYDARIVDDRGRVHVTVDGYRTTAFDQPYDRAAATRIRRALGSAGVVGGEQRPGLG